jgi:hypothetical protein
MADPARPTVPDAKGVPPVNPPSAFDPATNTITVDAPAPTTNGKETAKKADAKAVAKQTKPACARGRQRARSGRRQGI